LRGSSLDYVDHRRPPVRTGGDIEEDHLVCTLVVVPQGEVDRVADVPQPAFFGAAKLDAAGDFPIVHIEAWDDAFG
jgi:hypothetical protein